MANPLEILRARATATNAVRSFFASHGYLDVDTPICVRSPGMEPNLMPFETTVVNECGERFVAGLITSPEYSMKKLMGLGAEKIFTLTHVFRNGEEFGGTHNPEFTMLEWYEQGVDYQTGMDQTEALVRAVASELQAAGFKTIELPQQIKRVRIRDLFLSYIDLDTAGPDELRKACEQLEIHTDPSDTESDLFYRLMLAKVEPALAQEEAVFIYDYPLHQAALSSPTSDGKYGQRFELYINGLELCNGFTELTNAAEQRRRFEIEAQERRALGKTVFPIDEEFLRLLSSVRQPSFGNALGFERLLMALLGTRRIEDVMLFPAGDLFKSLSH